MRTYIISSFYKNGRKAIIAVHRLPILTSTKLYLDSTFSHIKLSNKCTTKNHIMIRPMYCALIFIFYGLVNKIPSLFYSSRAKMMFFFYITMAHQSSTNHVCLASFVYLSNIYNLIKHLFQKWNSIRKYRFRENISILSSVCLALYKNYFLV